MKSIKKSRIPKTPKINTKKSRKVRKNPPYSKNSSAKLNPSTTISKPFKPIPPSKMIKNPHNKVQP
jgi:hypothetical protein